MTGTVDASKFGHPDGFPIGQVMVLEVVLILAPCGGTKKRKKTYNILLHAVQIVFVNMDCREIPVRFDHSFEFGEPGLISLFYRRMGKKPNA